QIIIHLVNDHHADRVIEQDDEKDGEADTLYEPADAGLVYPCEEARATRARRRAAPCCGSGRAVSPPIHPAMADLFAPLRQAGRKRHGQAFLRIVPSGEGSSLDGSSRAPVKPVPALAPLR